MERQLTLEGETTRPQRLRYILVTAVSLALAIAALSSFGIFRMASPGNRPAPAAHVERTTVDLSPIVTANSLPAELGDLANLQAAILAQQPASGFANSGPISRHSLAADLSDLANLQAVLQSSSR